jgi:hypothetical protein
VELYTEQAEQIVHVPPPPVTEEIETLFVVSTATTQTVPGVVGRILPVVRLQLFAGPEQKVAMLSCMYSQV